MTKSKLDKLLTSLEKKYIAKKATDFKAEKKIRTGIFPLDSILSGGISDCIGGHRLEFFGAESSAKTTMALKVIKQYQADGKTCVFIDGENSYDAEWAEILGIDNDNLIMLQPTSLEELGDMLPEIIPEADLIVIDSIVSFIPEAEEERDTNQPTMGLQARTNALITRKLYKAIADRNITMIFINQLREKIGVMYGNPHTTGGGRALKHFYNTRIEFRAGKPIDVGSGDKKERIGMEIHMKAVKNKKGIPYKTAVCNFYYDGTIDNKTCLFFSALKHDIIQLSGKSYSYGDIKIVGKQNFLDQFDKWDEVEAKLWEVMK
jgi:recombination protein RecA